MTSKQLKLLICCSSAATVGIFALFLAFTHLGSAWMAGSIVWCCISNVDWRSCFSLAYFFLCAKSPLMLQNCLEKIAEKREEEEEEESAT